MPQISEAQLQPLLQAVTDPGSGRTLGESKALKNVRVDGADVTIEVELGYP
ncbi:iron-sulfur cluster assembly protein, partial [Flavobacterium sp. LaA7.5]|nr:iron-sulfur cluster assembly protein [Flavobacterium salilacus subsp. altitudinum]